jgi:hypothetical protein
MAARDIQVRHSAYGTQSIDFEANVDVGIEVGDVVKRGGTGGNFGVKAQTGDPEAAVDITLGVIKVAPNHEVGANGTGVVELVGPGSVISGKATTPGNIDTAAKLLAVKLDFVTFDRSADTVAGILTIDEDEGDDPNVHGLCIIGGDIEKGTLDVLTAAGLLFGSTV